MSQISSKSICSFKAGKYHFKVPADHTGPIKTSIQVSANTKAAIMYPSLLTPTRNPYC